MRYLARSVGFEPKQAAFDLIKSCLSGIVGEGYVLKNNNKSKEKEIFNKTLLFHAMQGKKKFVL